MKVVKTKAYRTTDGRMFDDRAEAARHERGLALQEVARKLVAIADNGGPEGVANALRQNAGSLVKLLGKFVEKAPKAQPAPAGEGQAEQQAAA